MKKNRFLITLIGALVLLTAVVAAIHLTSRTPATDGCIQLEVRGTTSELSFNDLPLDAVQGTVVNGKGEHRSIDAQGIALSALLAEAGVTDFNTVSVVADDEYRADVFAEEIFEDCVFLLISADEQPQLVVFGDENSKRNVTNVVRLVIV